MSVYYNALRRLRAALKKAGLEGLLVRTPRGQMVDTRLFDCDYYDWKDGDPEHRALFEGEFLPEYSWGEYILAEIVNEGRDCGLPQGRFNFRLSTVRKNDRMRPEDQAVKQYRAA